MQHRWSGPRAARPRGTISPNFPGSGPNGPPSTCTTPRWRLWTTPKRTPPSSEVRHDPHLVRAGRPTSSKGGKAEAGNVAPLPAAATGRIRRTALRVPPDHLPGYRGPVRIATWNVNSIRARAERVLGWLERHDVDVLAIQETKCTDEKFPFLPFEAAGYEVAHWGINQWNGVAVISRVGIDGVRRGFAGQPTWSEARVLEPRALGARCNGVHVWSLYVPNGRTPQDPHYTYKLDWLTALRAEAAQWAGSGAPIALMGDWNVAPLDEDVWDISEFEGATHVTAPEREAFAAFAEAGYLEISRELAPGKYTYWDYQKLRFPKNEGM